MLKKISYLLLLVAIAFVGCTKDEKDDKNNDKLGGDIGLIMSGEILEVDEGNKVTDYHVSAEHKIKELVHQGDQLYYFETEVKGENLRVSVILRQRDNSSALLKEKTYNFDDPDYMLYFDVNTPDADNIYSMGDYLRKEYEETRIYGGEPVVPTGKVKITKLTSERIEGEFEFEAYTWGGSISKVIVKDGKFKGLRQ